MTSTHIDLQDSADLIPKNHKVLMACVHCKLVLDEQQWNNHERCPNPRCNYEVTITKSFTGLMSLIMPSESWVARWNNQSEDYPGVYAVHIDREDSYDNDAGYDDQAMGVDEDDMDMD